MSSPKQRSVATPELATGLRLITQRSEHDGRRKPSSTMDGNDGPLASVLAVITTIAAARKLKVAIATRDGHRGCDPRQWLLSKLTQGKNLASKPG